MKVFIVGGGGTLGSTTAFYLASRSIVDEVVLYDIFQPLAIHHAMDIGQAVCTISKTKIRTAMGWGDIAQSDIVIVAAGLTSDKFTGDFVADVLQFKPLIREMCDHVKETAPHAVIISMTNPVDVFNYLLYQEGGIPKQQLLGFSYNDTIRMRWAVAQYYDVDASTVSATVAGQHGPARVQLFSTVAIGDQPKDISSEELGELGGIQGKWWQSFNATGVNRTAGWTSAVGVTAMVESVLGIRTEPIPCSCILEGEYGFNGISMGVPACLGLGGVEAIIPLEMTSDERSAVEESAAQVSFDTQKVLSLL